MDEASEYDWVDDENLDLAEPMRRFEALEPALVVAKPIATSAGTAAVVTQVIGQQRLAARFA